MEGEVYYLELLTTDHERMRVLETRDPVEADKVYQRYRGDCRICGRHLPKDDSPVELQLFTLVARYPNVHHS